MSDHPLKQHVLHNNSVDIIIGEPALCLNGMCWPLQNQPPDSRHEEGTHRRLGSSGGEAYHSCAEEVRRLLKAVATSDIVIYDLHDADLEDTV